MPRYDVVERHRIRVLAAPATVYAAIRTADLTGGPFTRLLLAIRKLPAALLAAAHSPREAQAEWRAPRTSRDVTLAGFERAGVRVVAERPPGRPERHEVGNLGSRHGADSRTPGHAGVMPQGFREMIQRADQADGEATDKLFAMLYHELRRLAEHNLRRAGAPLTLGTTTLLHEAYLNIAGRENIAFADRPRFLAYASRAM